MTAPTGVLAIVGGGQLARMMVAPAAALGLRLRFLVASPDDPVAAFSDHVVGTPDDLAVMSRLTDGATVVSWEHEHIPPATLDWLSDRGVVMRPGPHALVYAQDKILMRQRLTDLGIACPQWTIARTAADVDAFAAGPVVAKTPRGGYDGRGVRVVESGAELTDWLVGGPVLIEEKVDFSRELTVVLARRPSGDVRHYDVVETVQVDGICYEVTAPALGLDTRVGAEAVEVAHRIANELDVTGVLAVELFQLREQRDDGARVVVNELAMRPHNTGHWTIDGAVTSQFEQHLRAVLDLPLGDTRPRDPFAVMVNVLGGGASDPADRLPEVLTDDGLKIHLYGKAPRLGRKLGHVTATGRDVVALRGRAQAAAAVLSGDAATLAEARDIEPRRGGHIW